MRELGFKRVLFLVHRNQIAKQAKLSFERVFGSSLKTGLLSGSYHNYEADYLFATVQTLSKQENLEKFSRDYFNACIYDEAHHTSVGSYKRVMDYFTPQFTLGMTATPDKRDDNVEGTIFTKFSTTILPMRFGCIINIMTNEFPTGASKSTYSECVFMEKDNETFLHATERGIQVYLLVRKNKDDKIFKEFYYLGYMQASGKVREFILPNTDKTAVEIEWLMDVPVHEDLYEYIVNG